MDVVIFAIELPALLIAFFYYPRYKHSILKWILPFLLFINIAEALGYIFRQYLKIANTPVYSISIPIEFSFYTFLFYHFLKSERLKKILFILWLLMFVYDLGTNMNNYPDYFDFNILLFGNILMFIACTFYFWELFSLENDAELFSIPFFWVAAGVFLFNLGEISYNFLGNYLISRYDSYSFFLNYFEGFLCVILYSLLIKAILTKPITVEKD